MRVISTTDARPGEQVGKLGTQVGKLGVRERADDEVRAGCDGVDVVTHKMAELADHTMPLNGVADHLSDNKTRPGRWAFRAGQEMENEMR